MFCSSCGNSTSFRINNLGKNIFCRNIDCNAMLRNRRNFNWLGVDEIKWFSELMTETLNKNPQQVFPHWKERTDSSLIQEAKERIRALELELKRPTFDRNEIKTLCCEVALFFMAITDNAYEGEERKIYADTKI